MKDRVYFIHESGIHIVLDGRAINVLGADFFVKSELAKQYDEGWSDYLVEDCPYVKAFLKEHPDYKYIGSTDNIHADGWGVNFDGFTKVDCPKVEGD